MEKSRLSFASYKLIARGVDVYESGKVRTIENIGDNKYKAYVDGSQNSTYEVILDDNHLTKSTCTCPYCDGHQRRFCKHKVATFFKLYPNEYKAYHDEILEEEKRRNEEMLEYERAFNEMMEAAKARVLHRLSKMTPEEIKEELYVRLIAEETEYEEEQLDREYGSYDDDYYF